MGWLDKKVEEKKVEEPEKKEQTKNDADELILKMRGAFEETLKPIRDKVDSYEARFGTIEQSVRKPEPKKEDATLPSVLDDEDAAFNSRLVPQNVAIATLNARLTEGEVLNDMQARGWGDYIPKVRKVLDEGTNIQTKADPNYKTYVQNVVKLVIGNDAIEKGLRFDSSKQTFFLEDSSKTTSSGDRGKYSKLVELAADGTLEVVKGNTPEDVVSYLDKKLGIKDIDKFLQGAQ
jgi:hypothetical protein